MSYAKLAIGQQANDLSIALYKMTFSLPTFVQFEEVHQIRRTSKFSWLHIVVG